MLSKIIRTMFIYLGALFIFSMLYKHLHFLLDLICLLLICKHLTWLVDYLRSDDDEIEKAEVEKKDENINGN